jgi:uncharacterized cupin superfamily protein
MEDGKFVVTGIHCLRHKKSEVIAVNEGDVLFMQHGSMAASELLRIDRKADELLWRRYG